MITLISLIVFAWIVVSLHDMVPFISERVGMAIALVTSVSLWFTLYSFFTH